jgi:diguanylate cyclase (GGDEF)-like protein
MTPEQIGTLVSVIGLLTQIGGNLLLVGLFFALRRGHPRRQPFFREWTHAWAWLLAGLTGVLLQYAIPWVTAHPPAVRAANLLYQAGKLLFVVHLVAGTLNYASGVRPTAFRRRAVPVVLLYAAVSASLPGVLLNGVVLLQIPLMAGPFLFCAWLLLRLPPSRGSFGSRATGAVFGAIALLWVGYAAAYASVGVPPLLEAGGPGAFLLRYNSYLDLLLQMLLAYGMVVLLLEDAKREADDARAQLSLAHDRLKRASLYDALTGALNRRAFEDGVGMEAVEAGHGTALMLDMDNLKVVNDTHGHRAGDELLCRLVETLRGCMQPNDRLYRWGGDEFLVLAPAAEPEAVAPCIRAAVEAANARYTAESSPLYLQVSLGAAGFESLEEVGGAMERADRAMYEDKARNRRALSSAALPAG